MSVVPQLERRGDHCGYAARLGLVALAVVFGCSKSASKADGGARDGNAIDGRAPDGGGSDGNARDGGALDGMLDASSNPTPYSNGHEGGVNFSATEECRDDTFTITGDFRQATQTGAVALATIGASGEVRTARIIEDTKITAGATVLGVAACIGTSGTPCGYAGPFPLMGASDPAFKSYTASGSLATAVDATQALQLQLSVTGGAGNLATLTGGVVKTRVCAMVAQP